MFYTSINVSQPLFHGGTPKINFSFPEVTLPMKAFTRQEERGSTLRTEITPVLPIAGQNFQRHLEVYFEFFAVF
jgi:hypothetical protein